MTAILPALWLALWLTPCLTLLPPPAARAAEARAGGGLAPAPGERRHLVFWKGTPQELEVFRSYGRKPGPTVMIMGGIQGDEPGGFLSAELYADLSLEKGNLIVVPRANFRSVILNNRGPFGDMNRKFEDDLPHEPELNVVEILKSLMAESDLLLNLHDGSGFYRATWESDIANPKRYGQCIIADTDIYVHTPSGRTVDLKTPAEAVVARLNTTIDEPLHRFHFFNMETVREDTPYLEQRRSASYFALTRLGIPAFGIETSKQLPSLEMKVRQHVLAVNAFLDIVGVEVERPGIALDKPALGYVIIAVNTAPPIAVAPGQTLLVAPGDTVEVLHLSANYERGLSVEIQGAEGLNHLNVPVRIDRPTTLLVRRDSAPIGRISVEMLPKDQAGTSPKLLGAARAAPARQPTPATLEMLAGTQLVAAAKAANAVATRGKSPADGGGSGGSGDLGSNGSFVGNSGNGGNIGTIGSGGGSGGGVEDAETAEAGSGTGGIGGKAATAAPAGPGTDISVASAGNAPPSLTNNALSAAPQKAGNAAATGAAASTPATGTGATSSATGTGATSSATGTNTAAATSATRTTGAAAGNASAMRGKADNEALSFLFEVNGRPVEVRAGEEYEVARGARVKLVDIKSAGPLPVGVVMNLRGFVPDARAARNTGEDRGAIADTSVDLRKEFSVDRKGERYAVNAELGKRVLASCLLRIAPPKAASVTIRYQGATRVVRLGSRLAIPAGTRVELLEVSLPGTVQSNVRCTLAGHPLPAGFPKTLVMRDIAINLAVFAGDSLAGKVTWVPQ